MDCATEEMPSPRKLPNEVQIKSVEPSGEVKGESESSTACVVINEQKKVENNQDDDGGCSSGENENACISSQDISKETVLQEHDNVTNVLGHPAPSHEQSAFEEVDLNTSNNSYSSINKSEPQTESSEPNECLNEILSSQSNVNELGPSSAQVKETTANCTVNITPPLLNSDQQTTFSDRHELSEDNVTDLQGKLYQVESAKASTARSELSPVNLDTGSSLNTVKCEQQVKDATVSSLPSAQVLTIAEDRLSLLSYESDCASSSEPIESGLLCSSRCTSSDDEDERWMANLQHAGGHHTPRRKSYEELLACNNELQQSLSLLSKKVAQQERQLADREAEFQESMARARAQTKAQTDKLKAQIDSARKDKEAMVVRYAQSEREVINGRKAKEVMDKKFRDLVQERDSLLGKLKVLHADRVRACSSLDVKMAELAQTQREAERWKEELHNRDIKIKWAQNKLKEESDAHKETQSKLEQTLHRLRETREESEQVRKDCQDMIRRYQEAEEIKSVSLDQQLKMKVSELEVQKQERNDQEELYLTMRRELDAFKRRDRTSLEENNGLTVKIQTLERERLEHEQTVSKLKETLNQLRQEAVDLNGKLAEMESVGMQLDREREKVSASQREVERIRAAHQELQSDLEACHTKEGELLEFTQRLTAKTVHLQSEHSLLEVKAQNLEEEVGRLSRHSADLELAKQDLQQDLDEASRLRLQETQLLARKLAEKTKAVEALNLKLDEAENEARVLKRRHLTSIKELSRELVHAKKFLEQVGLQSALRPTAASATPNNNHQAHGGGSTPGESHSLQGSSRTSSSGSLAEMNSANHNMNLSGGQQQQGNASSNVNSHHPPPAVTFSNRRSSKSTPNSPSYAHRTKKRETVTVTPVSPTTTNQSAPAVVEIDQQVLINRIDRLQKTLARRNEKVDFLEEHVNQLHGEIKKKSKVIQNYILREEAGALAPNTMDQNKVEVLRRGGIMASVYGSHATDASMTLDLSLEINRKLQTVLEDTILKNITLKENINTLGDEIARISKEQRRKT